jgi:hypothetical protein
MKKYLLSFILFFFASNAGAQMYNKTEGYKNFTELKEGRSSSEFDAEIKQRSTGDIFMTGGIANYVIKKANPKSDLNILRDDIYAIKIDNDLYINEISFTGLARYDKIIEVGYYTYFTATAPLSGEYQEKLGIIKPGEKPVAIAGMIGVVVKPDGTISMLTPQILLKLCRDNHKIYKDIIAANLQRKDVPQMYDFLKQYNASVSNPSDLSSTRD